MAITRIQIYETLNTTTNPHGPDSTGFSCVPDPEINARGSALDADNNPLVIAAVRIKADNSLARCRVATQCSGPNDGTLGTNDERFIVEVPRLTLTVGTDYDTLRFTDESEASVDVTLEVIDVCTEATPCTPENSAGYPKRFIPEEVASRDGEEAKSKAKGGKAPAVRVIFAPRPGKVAIHFPLENVPVSKALPLYALAETSAANDLLSATIWQLKGDGTVDGSKPPIDPSINVMRLGRFAIFKFPAGSLPTANLKLVVHSSFIGPGSVKFRAG